MIQKQEPKKPLQTQGKPMQHGSRPKRQGGSKFQRINRSAIGKNWKEIPGLKPMVWKPEESLKIIPLGGMEEVGRNMTVFEYGEDIVILDMGLQFPEEDMPGIDYVIPNTEYLKGKEKNIKAVIFSHGHLDHIGAAAILLKKLNYPQVIGRPLTMEMIKHRMEDFEKGSSKKLQTTYIKSLDEKINLGNFNLSFFAIDHAIMDAVGVII